MNAAPSPARRPFLWMLGAALLALTVFASVSIYRQRQQIERQVLDDLQSTVHTRVEDWETRLTDGIDQWLDTVAAGDPTKAAAAQASMRSRAPWFDSVYIWRPRSRDPDTNAVVPGRILFPGEPPDNTPRAQRHPCITRVRRMAVLLSATPQQIAQGFVTRCARAPLEVRVFAAGEASQLLSRAGDNEGALAALDTAGLDHGENLADAFALGLTPFEAVVHSLRRASYLSALDRNDEAVQVWRAVGSDIAGLDAPAAAGVLVYDWAILRELDLHAAPEVAQGLHRSLSRARRRARAWDEIQRRIIPQMPVGTAPSGRFVYDQYEDIPYILYYSSVRGGALGGAIVLDQPTLLDSLIRSLGDLAPYVEITDAKQEHVAGVSVVEPAAVPVTLPVTLTHLRLHLAQGAVNAKLRRFGSQWITQLTLLLVFVAIGFGGLYSQIRAVARQHELLLRQREFTTRVTHELKTPLAGMRVMAENIEMGAYASDAQREAMAVRIQAEADRLSARLDEVLRLAKEDRVPDPKPFDPEDIALDVIEAWGPRCQEAGVLLHADLGEAPELKGDETAVRDAVSNLLDNALKYQDPKKPTRDIWLIVSATKKFVVFEVADNGLGVPPAMRKTIFERFVRVEGPDRGAAGGHGLGLAMVARVARAHHGTVTCTEGLDGGTRFTLRLRRT